MPGGRPLKNGVDYFPLDVILDDKFELIEAEHGMQGFGVLIKIYQKIYANNYWVKFDKKAVLVFSNRVNVDINSINAIINSCIEWEIFDSKLFKDFEVLTSTGIQKRFFEIVKRRKVVEVCSDFLLIDFDINGYNNLVNVDHNSQRKGKVKESKEKDISQEIYDFTEQFILFISKSKPSIKKSNLEKSADTVDKLIRLDKYSLDYIRKVLLWAVNDDFWSSNVFSLVPLRQKSPNTLSKFQNIANGFEKDNGNNYFGGSDLEVETQDDIDNELKKALS